MRIRSVVVAGAVLLGLWGQSVHGTPITGVDVGGGWKWSPWFGYFCPVTADWVYHGNHGWLYVSGTDESDLFLWSPQMDWIWTGSGTYPWLYSSVRSGWYYYATDTQSPRWFYNASATNWQAGFTAAVTVTNHSTTTLCTEEDNINWPLTGSVEAFLVETRHPGYPVTSWDCSPNFANCTNSASGYPFTPATVKLYDDGMTVVDAVRASSWWLPTGMTVSVTNGCPQETMHMVRLYRKVAGESSWPQVLVFYMDGSLRLIPQPPVGAGSVCFGSSVVVGPADISMRPLAQVSAVNYDPAHDRLEVTYAEGGSALIEVRAVDRDRSSVRVIVHYNTSKPFATFESMYVSPGLADVDHVLIPVTPGVSAIVPIDTVGSSGSASWFSFYREWPSSHNQSAPNITISLE